MKSCIWFVSYMYVGDQTPYIQKSLQRAEMTTEVLHVFAVLLPLFLSLAFSKLSRPTPGETSKGVSLPLSSNAFACLYSPMRSVAVIIQASVVHKVV